MSGRILRSISWNEAVAVWPHFPLSHEDREALDGYLKQPYALAGTITWGREFSVMSGNSFEDLMVISAWWADNDEMLGATQVPNSARILAFDPTGYVIYGFRRLSFPGFVSVTVTADSQGWDQEIQFIPKTRATFVTDPDPIRLDWDAVPVFDG